MAGEDTNVKQYEGRWASKPEQVSEGILFSYYAPGAGEVFLSGDFNGWKHGTLRLGKGSDNVWRIILKLTPNRSYDYKYIIDGNWITDPNNPDLNPDTAGGANSIVYIGEKGNLLSKDDPERNKFTIEGRGIRRSTFASDRYKRNFDLFYVLPDSHDGERLPAVICLNNYIKSQEIDAYCRKYGYIGIMPSPDLGGDYIRKGKLNIFSELMNIVKERFAVDEDRIYVTGMSNGGLETLLVSMYFPDLIAASAVVFGPYKLRYYKDKIAGMDADSLRKFLATLDFPHKMLQNLTNTPLYISHGGGDEAVPADDAIVLHEIVEKLGAPVKFNFYPNEGHTWLTVDEDLPNVFDWFGKFKRQNYPKSIFYTAPFGIFKNKIYWAEFMPYELTQPVRIHIEVAGKGRISVDADNIRKITLKPSPGLIELSAKTKIETNRKTAQIDINSDANEADIIF
jgi:predicted esterase